MSSVTMITRWSCLCFAAVAISGCSHRVADEAGNNYRASGSNPDWTLTIGDSRMVFDRANGRDISVATPRALSRRAGQVYETPTMRVFVSSVERCTESEGQRVEVTVEATTYRGCGTGDTPD